MLDCVTSSYGNQHTYTVIWLHGLGADGHDFESVVPELNLPQNANIKFIFPHAPIRLITINGGFEMRGWYDIKDMASLENNIDVEGITSSIKAITQLIELQIEKGIPAENIILAGFSQGGAIATYAFLSSSKKLGGLISLSSYLPGWPYFKSQINVSNHSPITIAHGTYDPIVPFKAGEHLYKTLKALNLNPEFHSYPMEHSLCFEEVQMISDFLKNTLNLNMKTS
ncbi:alpha/beta hydrolase [Thiotrichales bacterium 19S11-10]|nr:alpha/beta hydrolase [Thiotrichales bacterium 19S11-10]